MCSSCSATTPAPLAEETRWEGVKESGQVTPHIKSLPSFHGSNEIPSGLLPSELYNAVGFDLAGTLAKIKSPADDVINSSVARETALSPPTA